MPSGQWRLPLGSSLLSHRSLLRKERLEQCAAVGGEHTSDDSAAMVQARIVGDRIERMTCSGLRVSGRVDHAGYARLHDGPRAHWAGLESDVERAIDQPP